MFLWSWGDIYLNNMLREGLCKEVIFEQMSEGPEEINS